MHIMHMHALYSQIPAPGAPASTHVLKVHAPYEMTLDTIHGHQAILLMRLARHLLQLVAVMTYNCMQAIRSIIP